MKDQIRTESGLNQLPMKPPEILKIPKMMMNARSDLNRMSVDRFKGAMLHLNSNISQNF